jgi:hypothetical protein
VTVVLTDFRTQKQERSADDDNMSSDEDVQMDDLNGSRFSSEQKGKGKATDGFLDNKQNNNLPWYVPYHAQGVYGCSIAWWSG